MNQDRDLGAVQAVLFFVFFVGVGDSQMLSPTLPLIAKALGLSPGEAGPWIGTPYALAAGLAALTAGPLSDRRGRKFFLSAGLALVAVAGLLVSASETLYQLSAVRFVAGAGGGMVSTCSIAYAGDSVRYERRGRAMGVIQSAYFAAFVLSIPLGSWLAAHWGWKTAYAATGAQALLALLVLQVWLPDDRNRPHAQGTLQELSRLRYHRSIYAAVIGSFFVSAGFIGFLQYFGSWMVESLRVSVITVGIVFMGVGVASMVGSVSGGSLSDRVGKRTTVVLCSVLLAVALTITAAAGRWLTMLSVVFIAALAYAFRQGPLQALITGLVPTSVRGAFVALRNTSSQFGIAVGSVLGGEMYSSGGFGAVGRSSGLLTLLAAVSFALVREPRGEELSPVIVGEESATE